jgi:RNA polymerase sigma factor (sigma-70 family)
VAVDWSTLVDRLRRGEELAAAELVSVLGAQLDLYSRTLDEGGTLSDIEREKAVENAIVKVARKIRDFDPTRATLPTWARGFVRNEMREALRKPREVPAGDHLQELLAQTKDRDDQAQAIAEGADPSERELAVLTLLLQLNPGDAELLYARAVERLTFQAIAERLDTGVTAAALRKRYQRARDFIIEAAQTDDHLKNLTEATETK